MARQAAQETLDEEDNGIALQLLAAVWQVFFEKKVVRLHTKALLAALLDADESPWEEANRGRAITAYWLRDELAGFLPRPEDPEEALALKRAREWREGTASALKGYTEEHLREAWKRYLDREPPSAYGKGQAAAEAQPAGPLTK